MSNELYPEWPQMAVSQGNQLHAVWFTRHKEDLYGSDKGAHYQIWYSSETLNTPDVAPLSLFTPVPTILPTTTPPPLLTPTPTPLAVDVAKAPTLDGPLAWEQGAMVNIAIALLPVLGLLLLFGGIAWKIQRRH